jgi:hypothetical protein
MMKWCAVSLAASLLLCTSALNAEVLCQNKYSGIVSARDECTGFEVKLEPARLGLQGLPSPNVIVRDANGAVVGLLAHVVDFDLSRPWVARRVGETTVFIVVERTGFARGLPLVLYETPDCSGTQFVPSDPASMIALARTIPDGTVALYPASPATLRTMRSELTFGNSAESCVGSGDVFLPPDRCCRTLADPRPTPASVAGILQIADLGLVPPFRVELP